jgi:SAM-dependent methyltransferase
MNEYREYPCDLCGSQDSEPIECAPDYTDGQNINVCKDCGFVYVPRRRTAKAIADDWSDRLFKEEAVFTTKTYSARIPAIKSRQVFVADTIDTELGLKDKSLCDIGAGEGQFLEIVKSPEYGAQPYGIEPSSELCQKMSKEGIRSFCGAIEDYVESGEVDKQAFDIVTIMWTLECSADIRLMLKAARDALKNGGHVVISTGSRILVPFKKPLQFYFDSKPLDTHPFRFSANTLQALLISSGFRITFVNRYVDQDWLVVIAEKSDDVDRAGWQGDDCNAVIDFFDRWDKESKTYYADYHDE